MDEWRRWFMGTVFAEPLFDTVAEVDTATGQHVVDTWPATMSIRDVYEIIQSQVVPKLLVDKTPANAAHPASMRASARDARISA